MKHSIGWMASKIGFWHVEDQPAFTRVGEREPQFVPNKRPQLVRLGRIQQRMKALDQLLSSVSKTILVTLGLETDKGVAFVRTLLSSRVCVAFGDQSGRRGG